MPLPAWRLALACALLGAPLTARPNGGAMLTGPVALPRDLVSPDEPAERGLRVFAGGALVRTELDFSEVQADLGENALQLGIVKRTSENYFLMLSAGLLAGSTFDPHDQPELELGAGVLLQAAATWRVWEGYDEDPFVTVTGGFTVVRGETSDGERLDLNDLSLGLAVGKAFLETFAPYVAVKGFAGPSSWRYEGDRVRGHDLHRWAAAVGLVAASDAGFDVQVEVAPVGARAAVLSVGYAW